MFTCFSNNNKYISLSAPVIATTNSRWSWIRKMVVELAQENTFSTGCLTSNGSHWIQWAYLNICWVDFLILTGVTYGILFVCYEGGRCFFGFWSVVDCGVWLWVGKLRVRKFNGYGVEVWGVDFYCVNYNWSAKSDRGSVTFSRIGDSCRYI